MSQNPSYVMSVFCAAGGVAGYARSRSVPSLIAGIGVGAMYGVAGYLLKKKKKYGRETRLIASIIMASSMVPRALKTPQKAFSVILAICSVTTSVYYTKEIIEKR